MKAVVRTWISGPNLAGWPANFRLRYHQFPQLAFGNGHRRKATIEANQHLWKKKESRFVQILAVRKMNVYLSGENFQTFRCTGLTLHKYTTEITVWIDWIIAG